MDTTGYAWLLANSNQALVDSSGGNIGNVRLYGSRVVSSATLQVNDLTFMPGTGAALTAPAGTLYVSGNWNNAAGGTYNANGGTVVFDGPGTVQQLTSGGKGFFNLTVAAGATLQLEDDLTYAGAFTLNGTFDPNGHKVNGH